ncbi:MAG: hypothetical protein AABW51_02130 [Nanoarchaeota archaeon]
MESRERLEFVYKNIKEAPDNGLVVLELDGNFYAFYAKEIRRIRSGEDNTKRIKKAYDVVRYFPISASARIRPIKLDEKKFKELTNLILKI